MSDDLFLIAHKVRGELAFDIAQHMTCPVCDATNDHCGACDGIGHWWIIPTSGHRAFPAQSWRLSLNTIPEIEDAYSIPSVDSLRDHYTTEREVAKSLIDTLGLKPTPPSPILRRI